MTTRLQSLLDEVRALPDERQDEIAALLAIELGHEVEIPEWHKEILAERIADMERNPDEGIPAEDVFEELRMRWKR